MSLPTIARLGAAALAIATGLVLSDAAAQPKSRADCEAAYKPRVGQSGKDVVWVPTPDELVDKMLRMANTTAHDHVIDLGAGDGKIAIAAAKTFGATALGIEYNPDMVRLADCWVQVAGVSSRVNVIEGDIFKEDFSKADVVTMYLLPELNLCIRHRLLAMRPGTRVASHEFMMGDWNPDNRRVRLSPRVPLDCSGARRRHLDAPGPRRVTRHGGAASGLPAGKRRSDAGTDEATHRRRHATWRSADVRVQRCQGHDADLPRHRPRR
jgi:SAM-dependent methyltransferase